MANILTKGTKVLCPRKRHLIGVLNQDLESGFLMRLSVIDFESGQERVMGEKCFCKIPGCNSEWLIFRPYASMNTEHGWWPRDPQLETPPR